MPNELNHYGVKGMRWGVRRYQDKHGRRTAAGKKRYSQKEKSDKEKKGLTDKQKRAIKIGAAAVGTALVAYGGYKLYQSGALDRFVDRGRMKVDSLLGSKKTLHGDVPKLKTLDTPEPLSDTLKKVNPLNGLPEGRNNCTCCGVASILRQRGYDVSARGTGGEAQNLGGVVEACFKNVKVLDGSASKFGRSKGDAAAMLVKRYGDNAAGVCGITWLDGTGHTFNWQIQNGVVTFFDAQKGRGDSSIGGYWNLIDPNGSLTLARLDNAELNFDGLSKYVK